MLDTEHARSTSRVLDSTLARRAARSTCRRWCGCTRWNATPSSRRSTSGRRASSFRTSIRAASRATAVRLAHYGDGGRGFSPSTRSAGWGSRSMADILDAAARTTTVVIQIEDPVGARCRRRHRGGGRCRRACSSVAPTSPWRSVPRRGDDERVLAAVERIAALLPGRRRRPSVSSSRRRPRTTPRPAARSVRP